MYVCISDTLRTQPTFVLQVTVTCLRATLREFAKAAAEIPANTRALPRIREHSQECARILRKTRDVSLQKFASIMFRGNVPIIF